MSKLLSYGRNLALGLASRLSAKPWEAMWLGAWYHAEPDEILTLGRISISAEVLTNEYHWTSPPGNDEYSQKS